MLNLFLQAISIHDDVWGTVYFDAEFRNLCVRKSRVSNAVNDALLPLP